MIVRTDVLRRRQDVSEEAFERHWRDRHGPLAAKLPGLRRYEQNLVVDRSQLAIDHARGTWEVDGFSQLWFDDVEAMRASTASPEFAAMAPDVDGFVGQGQTLVCEPNVVVPVDRERSTLVKRMSLLRRRPDIDPARFRDEWFGFHADAVSKFPGLAGYTQNLVVDREDGPRGSGSRDRISIDGVVEMWFPDQAALKAAFRSPAAEVSQRHALDFIAEITTFLVEPSRVL